MGIRSVSTTKTSAAEAAEDIKAQLDGFDVKMLIYFASWEAYGPDEISVCMQDAFSGGVVFGCSSHAEIYNTETLVNSVSAMAFSSQTVADVKVEVIENLSEGVNIKPAFDSFDKYFGTPMAEADYKKYAGIVLIDGLSRKEEEVVEKIGLHSNIMFTGGSASDALKYESTYVYANGKAYADAALVAVFKTINGVDFVKTQSVEILDTTFTVTKAGEDNRTVIEFDNKPAAVRYAEALGAPRMGIEAYFFANPIGLVIEPDVYIRNCQRCKGDAMIFYCGVLEGMELRLLKITDIIPDTRAAVQDKLKEMGTVSGIIDFRCAFRTIQLKDERATKAYGEIFENIPTIGFSTYGEAFIGYMNQTSAMMFFK